MGRAANKSRAKAVSLPATIVPCRVARRAEHSVEDVGTSRAEPPGPIAARELFTRGAGDAGRKQTTLARIVDAARRGLARLFQAFKPDLATRLDACLPSSSCPADYLHPDLTTSEHERTRRHRFMSEANKAYSHGDQLKLRALLHEWISSPEGVPGEGVGAELIRAIRRIPGRAHRYSSPRSRFARGRRTPCAYSGVGPTVTATKRNPETGREERVVLNRTPRRRDVQITIRDGNVPL
jgi:hypothetical protein